MLCHICYMGDVNQTFGIRKTDFTETDIKILKQFTHYIMKNNIKSDVIITSVSFGRYKIINRINIYIENKRYKITLKNVYCGGVYGTDRIFSVGELAKKKFEHYTDYSLSNKYKWL